MEEIDISPVREIDRVSFSMPWPETAYRHEISDETRSLALVAELAADQVAEGQGREIDLHTEGSLREGSQAGGVRVGDSQIVGVLVVWLVLEEAHIATIAVHPDYRNRGISRQLLVVGLKGAIRRGAKSATLEVRASNIAARKLYRSFHFKIVGRRIRYYRDNNEDALIMNRDLLELENYPTGYLGWLESGAWRKNRDESHPAGRKFFDKIDLSKVE